MVAEGKEGGEEKWLDGEIRMKVVVVGVLWGGEGVCNALCVYYLAWSGHSMLLNKRP